MPNVLSLKEALELERGYWQRRINADLEASENIDAIDKVLAALSSPTE